ncbi:MAG: LysE family translocator [candidate division KSB1 bacterium]|nr:LysE family translocator [candidate division KSB1 bacterium]
MSSIPLIFPIITLLTGFAAAIPLGPVNLEIIRRVLDRHVWSAAAFALGAALADGFWPVVCFLGLAPLLDIRWVSALFWGVSSLLLMALGYFVINDALHPHESAFPKAFSRRKRLALIGGFMLVISNPTTLVSWIAIISFFDKLGILPNASPLAALLFWGTVSLGSFTYFSVMILLVHKNHHVFIINSNVKAIKIIFGVFILGIACYLGFHFVRIFIN